VADQPECKEGTLLREWCILGVTTEHLDGQDSYVDITRGCLASLALVLAQWTSERCAYLAAAFFVVAIDPMRVPLC
jgi:hypothetical protein